MTFVIIKSSANRRLGPALELTASFWAVQIGNEGYQGKGRVHAAEVCMWYSLREF